MNRLRYVIVAAVSILLMFGYSAYADKNRSSKCGPDVIDRVMLYPMPDIIARCQKDHHYTDEDMVLLENELKKYLILAIVHKDSKMGCGMYSKDVDNLWHTFLLFTKEYAAFCRDHAGFFIHHVPEIEGPRSVEKRQEAQQDFLAFIENYETAFNEEVNPIWLLDVYERSLT